MDAMQKLRASLDQAATSTVDRMYALGSVTRDQAVDMIADIKKINKELDDLEIIDKCFIIVNDVYGKNLKHGSNNEPTWLNDMRVMLDEVINNHEFTKMINDFFD